MQQAVKDMWIGSLRSGLFPQGNGALCRRDPQTGSPSGYCCLGVLATITGQASWNTNGVGDRFVMKLDSQIASGMPTGSLASKLEMHDPNPKITLTQRDTYRLDNPEREDLTNLIGEQISLVSLNDGDGGLVSPQPFEVIADLIETHM